MSDPEPPQRWVFVYRVPENPPERQFKVVGVVFPVYVSEEDVVRMFREMLADRDPQADWSTVLYASKPADDEPVVWKSPPGARVM